MVGELRWRVWKRFAYVLVVKAINQGKVLVLDLIYSPLNTTSNADEYETKHWSTRPGCVNPSQVYGIKASGIVLHKASFRLH